jgi:hypothetical protein
LLAVARFAWQGSPDLRESYVLSGITRNLTAILVAAAFLAAAVPGYAQSDAYQRAWQAYEKEADAYWRAVGEKRSGRNEKRRNGQPVTLNDYVLTQPPVYSGPPRPPGPPLPSEPRRPEMPVVADFLNAAAEEFGFVPRRPLSEIEFKRAYARVAMDAGLMREQAVGIYAFETGGNGAYDTQAGLIGKGKRAISPALGYNQLLSTNTVGLLAEHGDKLIEMLKRKADASAGVSKASLLGKIAALRSMVAFSRSVPNRWSEHDKLAKGTRGGIGIHATLLDLDLGPWLQAQKLLNSVRFARAKGYGQALTAAELELMNFTGDGNGIDMVLMPENLRARVPTANFFQQQGYERNPIARRTGVVAALIDDMEARMERAKRAEGAQDLDAAFIDLSRR